MIYSDEFVRVEFENSEIPWVKIFVNGEFKELSDLDEARKKRLFDVAFITERAMREFYQPEKINWASFANYVPRVHIHVQTRFKDDSFFPESMWGKAQREGKKRDLKLEEFASLLRQKILDEI